jgi:hypothetical protein
MLPNQVQVEPDGEAGGLLRETATGGGRSKRSGNSSDLIVTRTLVVIRPECPLQLSASPGAEIDITETAQIDHQLRPQNARPDSHNIQTWI